MLRRPIFGLGLLVFSAATAALVLFGVFLAWRIPREKAEARAFQGSSSNRRSRLAGNCTSSSGNHDHLALTGRSRINDQKYIQLADATGIAYGSLFTPATELGRWIRRHGVAVRVNDSLFVRRPALDAGDHRRAAAAPLTAGTRRAPLP